MGKITIQNLASVLVERNNLKQKQAAAFVNEIFFVIQRSLDREKLVKVKGLGTFKIIDVEDRESVNVNTGERVLIEGHGKISFTPDSLMKELVNKPFSHFETVVLNDGVDFSDVDAKEPEPEVESDADESDVEVDDAENGGIEKDVEIFEPLPFEEEEEAIAPAAAETQPAKTDTLLEAAPALSETADKSSETENVVPNAVATPLADVQPELKDEPAVATDEPAVATDEPANDDLIAVVESPVTEAVYPEVPVEQESADDSPAADEEPDSEDAYVDDEEESSSSFPWKWMLALLATLVAGVAIGYYLGSRHILSSEPAPAAPEVVEKPEPAPVPAAPAVTDSLAEEAVDTSATQKAVSAEALPAVKEKEAEKTAADAKPVAEKASAEKAAATPVAAPAAPVLDEYEKKDSRIRTGAYRIVGLDHQETVRPGDNLTRICKRTIGPGMECYLEAYNDLAPNSALKAGTKVKIPKLELKKKKAKK